MTKRKIPEKANKTTKEKNKKIVKFSILVLFSFLILLTLVGFFLFIVDTALEIEYIHGLEAQLTYLNCCNNTPCTDTYYTSEDNLCHLVLCENLYGKNNPKCVYQGANRYIKRKIKQVKEGKKD